MANTILTPSQVTREALRMLHQKLNFIGSINRQYDDQYAKSGAKIGDSLKIRLPNQYVVRSGPTLVAQDTTENSVTLQIGTGAGSYGDQRGVDLNFTSADLTLSLDDFSKRILNPAMAVLAASIESHMLGQVYKDVYNQVNNQGVAATFAKVLAGRKQLVDNLAPAGDRSVCLSTQDNADLVDALKGLFQDSSSIAKQYREGYVGRTGGFDFLENTLLPSHPRSNASNSTVNGASQVGGTIAVNTTTVAPVAGDIVTLAGCNRVHPETKVSTGVLQQFVILTGSTATSLLISPSIVTSGALQNVSASPTSPGAVTFAGTANVSHGISLAYHQDAFTFATADCVMPKGVDFSAREVFDGISMRIVRAYDINNDKFPCRLDVIYGFKTIRPQLATRLANN